MTYLFENWKLFLAFALPYFFRSTTLESRVRKPPDLSTALFWGSKFKSAFEIPCRIAPACPDKPPPETVQNISKLPLLSVASRGCCTIILKTGLAKNISNSLAMFDNKKFFRNDEFSVLDAVIIPILLRLDHHQIKIPNNKASKPLFDYIERMQDLPSVKESFTSLEIELL